MIGQVLYPAGWSAGRVKDLCGDKAGPFLIDGCHIGMLYTIDIYCFGSGNIITSDVT